MYKGFFQSMADELERFLELDKIENVKDKINCLNQFMDDYENKKVKLNWCIGLILPLFVTDHSEVMSGVVSTLSVKYFEMLRDKQVDNISSNFKNIYADFN